MTNTNTNSAISNLFDDNNQKPVWYIIQTYVGFEDAVKTSLQQKINNLNLHDKILEIYIPTKKVSKLNKKGERKEKDEKIYPGYIYIHMKLDKETGYIIQNTNYVSRITGTGDVAVPLADDYVAKLKNSLIQNSQSQKRALVSSDYKIGDLVTVKQGPFKDMQGKVSAIDPKENKLDVVLTMFDRDTLVTLDTWEIKRVLD